MNRTVAVPRFLWRGFKRAGWIERAIVVTALLLLLGLLWPADDSEAGLGSAGWENPSQLFEFEGSGWDDLGSLSASYQNAVSAAAQTWADVSEFDPAISSAEQDNDIHWGDRPSGWSENYCKPYTPSSGGLAKECTRTSGGYIVESDILFNQYKSWNAGKVEGVAAHEFGHSGGLAHYFPVRIGHSEENTCEFDFEGRFTMCASTWPQHAHWWATPEPTDIWFMNYRY